LSSKYRQFFQKKKVSPSANRVLTRFYTFRPDDDDDADFGNDAGKDDADDDVGAGDVDEDDVGDDVDSGDVGCACVYACACGCVCAGVPVFGGISSESASSIRAPSLMISRSDR
jgi:hypothetical protein